MKADDQVYPENAGSDKYLSRGLTVRDHIAIEAMKAIIQNLSAKEIENVLNGITGCKRVRVASYMYADGQIEQSEK